MSFGSLVLSSVFGVGLTGCSPSSWAFDTRKNMHDIVIVEVSDKR